MPLAYDIHSGAVERISSNPHSSNSINHADNKKLSEGAPLVCKNPELKEAVTRHLNGWPSVNAGDRAQALLAVAARDHINSCDHCWALAHGRAGSA